ncbi:MAG: translation initiation factor IF-2 [bacterium]
MQRKRVYQVSKEFNISSEALIEMLHADGIEAKSHMSAVDDEVVEKIRKKFEAEKVAVKEEEARKHKIQEETRKVVPAPHVRPPAPSGPRPSLQARVVHKKKKRIDEKAVLENVKKTLADLELGKKKKRKKRIRATGEVAEENPHLLRVAEFIAVAELAALMDVSPSQVIAKAMGLGLMVTINQRLEKDTVVLLADEFGFQVEFLADAGEDILDDEDEGEESENDVADTTQEPRAPIVTVMGHVDHGKTTLLDTIRKSSVVAGEVGGITQHIGAYEVVHGGRPITFLDTPGHEAFSAMRARGAQLTDIVVLVVAADDRVMPQTVEAIDHAKAAGVPIIAAINKVDLPGVDTARVKQELAGHGLTPEEWGGKTITCEISAKTGRGIEQLLEMILLQAEVLELTADPLRAGKGIVVEARRDPGRGAIATVLVQTGTLRVGDPFVTGQHAGRIRAMFDERGKPIKTAPPSTPAEITGLPGVPQAGDSFVIMKDEKEARAVAQRRQQLSREQQFRMQKGRISLTDVYSRIKEGEVKRLNLIIKGDVDGSVEALADSLEKLSTDEVKVQVIRRGVGSIAESDILLAAASDAVVIGFHTKAEGRAAELAREEKVDVRYYQIIYEAVEDVRAALEGLLEPESHETVSGTAEVRKIFRTPKAGVIAGCYVQSGTVTRNARARLMRDGLLVHEGKLASLKRFKDDAREVVAGYECGIGIEGWNDIREGDSIEIVTVEEVARRL